MNPKIAVGIAAAGVILALAPVIAYIQSEIGGPLQQQFDTMIPGIQLHLLTALIGAAVTAGGLIMFVKAMRQQPLEYETEIPVPNQIQTAPATIGSKPKRMSFKGRKQDIQLIEKQIEELISSSPEDTMEVNKLTTKLNERKSRETKQEYKVTIVVRGTDEICRNCGFSNPIGAKVCSECGASLFTSREGEVACPVCGAPLSQAQKIGNNYVCQVCFSELQVENPFK